MSCDDDDIIIVFVLFAFKCIFRKKKKRKHIHTLSVGALSQASWQPTPWPGPDTQLWKGPRRGGEGREHCLIVDHSCWVLYAVLRVCVLCVSAKCVSAMCVCCVCVSVLCVWWKCKVMMRAVQFAIRISFTLWLQPQSLPLFPSNSSSSIPPPSLSPPPRFICFVRCCLQIP